MESGTIEFGQLMSDRASKDPLADLLKDTAEAIERLGSITLLDLVVQNLPLWQTTEMESGTYFTFRRDDLVTQKSKAARSEVKINEVDTDSTKMVKVEVTNEGGVYNYAALLLAAAKALQGVQDMQLASFYFDHRYLENSEPAFIVLGFVKANTL
jgi:hypothetical protein